MFIKGMENPPPKSMNPRAVFICAFGSSRHTFISMIVNIDDHQYMRRTTMKDSKKSAAKEKPATTVADRPTANVYSLSAEAKKLDPKTIKAETHRGACLLALKKLGSAPFSAILAEVLKQKTIKTDMDISKACRWMIFDMVRRGTVVVK